MTPIGICPEIMGLTAMAASLVVHNWAPGMQVKYTKTSFQATVDKIKDLKDSYSKSTQLIIGNDKRYPVILQYGGFMKAYGSKRMYSMCKIVRAVDGAARKIKVFVKNRKLDRQDRSYIQDA